MIRIILLILLITNTAAFGASAIDDTKPNMTTDTIVTGASPSLNTKVDKLISPMSEADIRTNFATAKSEIESLQTDLATNPADCAAGEVAIGILANRNLTCTGSPTLSGTLTAGSASVGAITCTDCLNATQIEDIYLKKSADANLFIVRGTDGTDDNYDTGNEICADAGETCVGVYKFVAGVYTATDTCATVDPNAGAKFYAECRK